jgi:hypothetical protein
MASSEVIGHYAADVYRNTAAVHLRSCLPAEKLQGHSFNAAGSFRARPAGRLPAKKSLLGVNAILGESMSGAAAGSMLPEIR